MWFVRFVFEIKRLYVISWIGDFIFSLILEVWIWFYQMSSSGFLAPLIFAVCEKEFVSLVSCFEYFVFVEVVSCFDVLERYLSFSCRGFYYMIFVHYGF